MISPETEQHQFAQHVIRLCVVIGMLGGIGFTLILLHVGNGLIKALSGISLLASPLDAVLAPLCYLLLGSMLLLLRHVMTLFGRRSDLVQQLPLFKPAQQMTAMAGTLSIGWFVIWLLSLWLPWYLAWPIPILALVGVLWRFLRPLTLKRQGCV